MTRHSFSTGHAGVQLASGLLTRSTTQTAIMMGAGMGSDPPPLPASSTIKKSDHAKRSTRFREHAAAEMLGVLRASLIGIRIVAIGLGDVARSNKIHSAFMNSRKSNHPDESLSTIATGIQDVPGLNVDLVLTPLDGATALADGIAGAMSVAAAGETDCFERFTGDDRTAFLTIAVPKPSMHPKVEAYLRSLKNTLEGSDLRNVLLGFEPLDEIVQLLRARGVPPVVAVTMGPVYKKYKLKINPWHRRRVLDGSVVATALAAFLDKVNLSVFISRWPQLVQIAIAAKGLGGEIIAIPLQRKGRVTTVTDLDLYRASDLVVKQNAILGATSISEVCVLDRVRFSPELTAKTETVTVSLATGRVTRQTDTFSLEGANARDSEGHELKLVDHLKTVWANVAEKGSTGRPAPYRYEYHI